MFRVDRRIFGCYKGNVTNTDGSVGSWCNGEGKVAKLAITTIAMYRGCVCVELELGNLDCFESGIGDVVAQQWSKDWVGEIGWCWWSLPCCLSSSIVELETR
jgi:hypothetical protein